MKNVILLVLIAFSIGSCTPIMKMIYGITKPKIENEASLRKYMKNKKISADNVYTLNFDNFFVMRSLIGGAIPEVLIFDKNGQFIPYGATEGCNAAAYSFIEGLEADKTYPNTDSTMNIDLDRALLGLCDLKGNSATVTMKDENDFYVFLYWTKYIGKLNKDHTLVWENDALNNPNAKIKVIKVNMDFQEYWGEENLNQLAGG